MPRGAWPTGWTTSQNVTAPKRFVLIDKLEQFDPETLQEFGAWAESQDLQIIGTRVSTGDECSIVIEDGYSSAQSIPTTTPQPTTEQEANPWQM